MNSEQQQHFGIAEAVRQEAMHPSWLHVQNLSIIACGLCTGSAPLPGAEPISDEAIATRAARIYKLVLFHARDL